MAEAALFLILLSKDKFYSIKSYSTLHVNVGTGKEITIGNLALMISKIIGFDGDIIFDNTKPDGMQKVLDIGLLDNMGWKPKTDLENGINILTSGTNKI